MIESNVDLILHVASFVGMFLAGAFGIKFKLNGTISDVKDLKLKTESLEHTIHDMDKKLAVIIATCPICKTETQGKESNR